MSSSFDPNPADNPYHSFDVHDVPLAEVVRDPAVDAEMIKRFRKEIHALGAFWILISLWWATPST
jgi:hypothetical protein